MSALLFLGYVAAVGTLAALAAWIAEPVLRALRWPTRWLWISALAGQIAALWLLLGDAATARPSGWAVATWGALSLAAAAYYLRAVVALRQERRSWRVTVAEEMPVWVSEKTGPAVIGFLRSIVVTPAWGLALEERERRLLLRHEAEHVEAWDPLLLLVGMVAVAAVPWSPAGWWALHRLRLAIEVDCDRRVLRAVPDVAAYGSLLLDVGARVTTGHAAVAAFAERRSALGERIDAMTARRPRRAGMVWTARSAFATGIVAVACRVPAPQAPAAKPASVAAETAAAGAVGGSSPVGTGASAGSAGAIGTGTSIGTGASAGGSGTGGGRALREAHAARDEESRRAQQMIMGILRRHFAGGRGLPITPAVVYAWLDDDGTVRVVKSVARDPLAQGYSISTSADDFDRIFPLVRKGRPVTHVGINDGPSLGLGDHLVIGWWQLGLPGAEDEGAIQGAVDRLFADAGAPPMDTAVGIVIAFDERWNVLEVRRVPVTAVPAESPAGRTARDRLLPTLRGRDTDREGALTGGGRYGLAPGSALHWWQRRQPSAPR